VISSSRPLSLVVANIEDEIDTGHLLGAVSYGSHFAGIHPESFGNVEISLLGDRTAGHTVWLAHGKFVTGRCGPVKYRYNDDLLFGFITLDESNFRGDADVSALTKASHAAYMAIFETIERNGFSSLIRCWNYIPRINAIQNGLERYMHFNIGRQDAFIAALRPYLFGSPSACALGTSGGKLVFYFLAAHLAAQSIENPRQISAYHYPEKYGPRSPTFSRASLLSLHGIEALLISGTASIVGHETLHHNDISRQTDETLRNLDVVIEKANDVSCYRCFSTQDLFLKVFIRHAEDFEIVASIIRNSLGDNINATWLQAEICRKELLVEIEAFGFCYENSP
jgi:chorismate lyase/3-hydroxybenzoate synthase